jgi:MFS family permease
MVAMLSALDQTVVSTGLPHIMSSLQAAALLGWVFTGYFVGATATVACVGKVGRHLRPQTRSSVFLISIALITAASLLCGLAVSMPLLVGFRAFQGIGSAPAQFRRPRRSGSLARASACRRCSASSAPRWGRPRRARWSVPSSQAACSLRWCVRWLARSRSSWPG